MKQIKVNNLEIELEKKKIKNMYLRILPPDGTIRISAPVRMSEEEILKFVISKLDWIKKQQEKTRKIPAPEDVRYESGDLIWLWGKKYRLNIKEGRHRNRVELEEDKVFLYTKPDSSKEQREKILNVWYKEELLKVIPALIIIWEKRIGVSADSCYIQNMKTRWGTCNTQKHRICLNLQLAKKPPQCLEYVVVHELTHLLERSHNHIFKGYMDRFLPEWREIKKELNKE